ncbi:MAG: hypothetical protein H7X97_02215 [Opitutaceae bacterium]|nr:hypothetical protein [Verrucomicrobiales bacterium]
MRCRLCLIFLTGLLFTLALPVMAEEKLSVVQTALSSTTLSGYVDASATWMSGTGPAVAVAVVNDEPSSYLDWSSRFHAWLRRIGIWIRS